MGFISDADNFGGIDSPKKQNKKKTTLVVKQRSMIILEVNIRKKVSCAFKSFLMYSSCIQYLITEYLCSYFLCRKCILANLRLSIFKSFWERMPWKGQKFSAMTQREFWGLNSSAPYLYHSAVPEKRLLAREICNGKPD